LNKLKAWLSAARLRTLPLSISGIFMGTALANYEGYENDTVFILALLTTISFQITSNFANDYGDGVKGTDDDDRVGPKRAIQSGSLNRSELLIGIVFSSLVSLGLTIFLVINAFGMDQLPYVLGFLVLGILSIWAALKYTMGQSPYGYQGLGDVFVFLFFGLLAVLGSKFLYTFSINAIDLLPAIGIGMLCVGVLNLNNLRDILSDEKHGKNTLIVKMGFQRGKLYHYAVLSVGFVCFIIFTSIKMNTLFGWIYLFFFVPVLIHFVKVLRTNQPKLLDPELKKLALSTFAIAFCQYMTVNYFL